MTSSLQNATLRRLFPRAKFPVAREVADVANHLQSKRLVKLAHSVRTLEIDAATMERILDERRN